MVSFYFIHSTVYFRILYYSSHTSINYSKSDIKSDKIIPISWLSYPGQFVPFGHVTEPEKVTDFSPSQNYDTIRNYCLQTGTLFEDHEFPASSRVLDDVDGRYSPPSRRRKANVEWLRPGVGIELWITVVNLNWK